MSLRTALSALLFVLTGASTFAADVKLGVNGITIDAPQAGSFVLSYPKLAQGGKNVGPTGSTLGDKAATLKYASGAEVRIDLRDGGIFQLYLSKLPDDVTGVRIEFTVSSQARRLVKWSANDQAAEEIPDKYDGKAFLFKGDAKRFTLIGKKGGGFSIIQPHGFQQFQDNREWKTDNCVWFTTTQIPRNDKGDAYIVYAIIEPDAKAPELDVKPVAGAAAPKASPKIDRYGQRIDKDYPEKVKSDEELKADATKQLAEVAAFKPDAKLDVYGGLAGSGEAYKLAKTGFFHVGNANGRLVLVTPDGNVYFQLGMCGIARTDDDTTVKGREGIYEWLPPKTGDMASAWRDSVNSGVASFYVANWVRKFGKPWTLDEWTGQVVQRLRMWGFNSTGAFSVNTPSVKSAGMPYVSFLPLGGQGVAMLPDQIGAGKILDPFAEGVEQALDAKFAKGVAANASDPLLIGYFLGNEQHVEMLPKLIPGYKASKVAAKAKLVEILADKYKEIAAFNDAWKPNTPFADFDALKEAPLQVRTDAANADVLAFYRLYLETYHAMVERLFRKYDSNHLLIGCRWTPGTANNKDAVEIGSKHLDLISINYYCYAIEKPFLDKVYEWSGHKAMIFSEWHYCSAERGLQAHVEVKDDHERGLAYRNYVEQSAALPYVVGHQWFIYTDQAITGRFFQGFHGEGNNTGFVDVADRPYPELVSATKETNSRIYDVMLGKTKPFGFEDPRFDGTNNKSANKIVQIPHALPNMKLDGTTNNWPTRPSEPIASSRIVVGKANAALRGDYRLCWDDSNLYFHIQVKDPTPMLNKATGGGMWNSDAVELFVGPKNLDQTGTMVFTDRQILIGAGEKPSVFIVDHPEDGQQCQVNIAKDVSGDGYTLQVAIPWKVLDVTPGSDMEMLFDVLIDNTDDGNGRVNQLAWNGNGQNSGNRSVWGRARISEN